MDKMHMCEQQLRSWSWSPSLGWAGLMWAEEGDGGGGVREEQALLQRPLSQARLAVLQHHADKTVIVLLRGPRAPLPLLVIYHTWQPQWTIITLPLSPCTVMSVGASVEGGREMAVRSGVKAGAGGEEEGESTHEKHWWKDGVWTFRKNNMQENQPERHFF